MSVSERELWMLSHRAPEGMLMIHRDEIGTISRQVMALSMERNALIGALGKLRRGDESPLLTIKRLLEALRARKQKEEL